MGFGHRVYKTGDPRARILKAHCAALAAEIGDDRWERIAEPIEKAVTEQKQLPAERRLAQRPALPLHGPGDPPLHADLRHGPGRRLGGPHHRAARPQPPDAAPGPLHRPAQPPRSCRSTSGSESERSSIGLDRDDGRLGHRSRSSMSGHRAGRNRPASNRASRRGGLGSISPRSSVDHFGRVGGSSLRRVGVAGRRGSGRPAALGLEELLDGRPCRTPRDALRSGPSSRSRAGSGASRAGAGGRCCRGPPWSPATPPARNAVSSLVGVGGLLRVRRSARAGRRSRRRRPGPRSCRRLGRRWAGSGSPSLAKARATAAWPGVRSTPGGGRSNSTTPPDASIIRIRSARSSRPSRLMSSLPIRANRWGWS